MTTTARHFAHTFRCVADDTRSARGTWIQCTRRVTGFSPDSVVHAGQDAQDRAVLAGWGVRGDDWSLATLRGLLCPRHATPSA